MTHANGTFVEYLYNDRQFLQAVINRKSNLEVISSFSYTFDSAGNRLSVTEADGSRTEWQYDDVYRLTREIMKDGNGEVIYDVSYSYDELGNRIKKVDNMSGEVINYGIQGGKPATA